MPLNFSKANTNLIDRLFRINTDNLIIQLFRYAFVGGVSFVVDYGTLWILTEYLGLHYLLSATIAFIFGLIVNYLLSIKWVFNSDQKEKTDGIKTAEFVGYAMIGIIGLGLNAVIIWFFTSVVSIHYMISKLISTIMVFFWNFFGRRYLIVKSNEITAESHSSH